MSEYVTVDTGKHVVVSLPPAPAVPAVSWLIAVDAFYDRFGAFAIPLLASPDNTIQAFFKFIAGRPFINLQRPELPGALDYIIAQGFAVDKAAILNTPCQPGEEPR